MITRDTPDISAACRVSDDACLRARTCIQNTATRLEQSAFLVQESHRILLHSKSTVPLVPNDG